MAIYHSFNDFCIIPERGIRNEDETETLTNFLLPNITKGKKGGISFIGSYRMIRGEMVVVGNYHLIWFGRRPHESSIERVLGAPIVWLG